MSTHRLDWQNPAPPPVRGGLVAIGNFDGVHRGHALLLGRVRAHADERRVPAVAVTFDPHPLRLLRPDLFQPTLTTLEERSRLLHEAGADHVIILNTARGLLELSAAEFFQRVIRENLQAVGLVEGPNFGFGRRREGDSETLAHFCVRDGLMLEIVEPLQGESGIVSSSRIRQALLAGDLAAAQRGLGRPYRLAGVVGTGQRRGQSLGFPTANLTQIETIIPSDGVYAVRAWQPASPQATPHRYAGAANIGPNPTFGEQARKVEVHLLGFAGDLYGQVLVVEFSARMRDTRRFGSVDELLEQIRTDVAQAARLAS